MTRLARLMPLGRLTWFWFEDGRRELVNPDGPPTGRQLEKLNKIGCLAVVEVGQVEPITKAQAAYAIDVAMTERAA
jgi:hypothetical protein